MDILYAPWRDKYVNKSIKKDEITCIECVFCEKFQEKNADENALILKRTKQCIVVMNLYPYNSGHLLVLPLDHVSELSDLSKEVRVELFELMNASIQIMKKVLKAEGINAGLNLGRASGAGIPKHLHLHIVPRWQGDTNFLPIIAETKQISVDMKRIYNELKPAFEALELEG